MKILNRLFRSTDDESIQLLDDKILFSAILLIAISMIMVYSASIAYAAHDKLIHNQYYYLIRHLFYIVIGLVAGIIAFILPTSFWRKYATFMALVIVFLLIIVLIPHVGNVVNGSRRWIGVGMLHMQPSEFAKLCVAIYLSDYVCNKYLNLKHFWTDLFPALGAICGIALLLLLEPDMGSATVIFIIALSIFFMANIDKKIIFSLSIMGLISFIGLIIITPYRMRRVLGFIDPWQDALGKGYQLTHSLLAVGHGGLFGVGVGNSIEKLFYLPEAHTDFIMAIIAEEFGAIGIVTILILFWIIFYRGFSIIGSEARKLGNRKFQSLLAQGISIWLFSQALINIGVTIGILPTKGLTLPFVSYGGSSMLVSCIALGILLKIDYENREINRELITNLEDKITN